MMELIFKSGEQAPYTGMYLFVAYVNRKDKVEDPQYEEKSIYLLQGYTFPPVRSTKQAALWKPM